jgi:hypothetical protein
MSMFVFVCSWLVRILTYCDDFMPSLQPQQLQQLQCRVMQLEQEKAKLSTQLTVLRVGKDEAVRKHKDVSTCTLLVSIIVS